MNREQLPGTGWMLILGFVMPSWVMRQNWLSLRTHTASSLSVNSERELEKGLREEQPNVGD